LKGIKSKLLAQQQLLSIDKPHTGTLTLYCLIRLLLDENEGPLFVVPVGFISVHSHHVIFGRQ